MDAIITLILTVVANFGTLIGVALLIAALVNLGKLVRLVKDGTASAWKAGLSLLAMAALILFRLYRPDFSLIFLDEQAGKIAAVLGIIIGYVAELRLAQAAHENFLAGTPLIGKSFSGRTAE